MTANMYSRLTGRRSPTAIALLMAILVVMLFSSCYIVLEADHDCCGACCPVCAVMQQCAANLEQLGAGQVIIIALAAVCCLFCHAIKYVCSAVSVETPITRKVRLND